MKVLQVNCVYNTGSTGKIMFCVHKGLLEHGHESVICYGRGVKTTDENVYKTCGELYSKFNNLLTRFTGIMYGGCFFSTNRLISIIKKEKPDIVHLHCINGYFVNIYRIITWLKKNKIKTLLTLHAEFMYTANCGCAFDCERWKTGCGNCAVFKKETKSIFFDRTAASFIKMKKAFTGFNENLIIASVSPWLMERALLAPILSGKKHVTVLNGLDTQVFSPRENKIKEELGINDKKMVLHVTPSFVPDREHIKGGRFVVELAKQMPGVVFVVVGSREQYDNLPDNVINVGRVENQNKLAEFYSAADLTLITSKAESFSMVTAESLCCGTYVVGFKAGGPEKISLDEYSRFVDYGNMNDLKNAIEHFLLFEKKADISEKAAFKFSQNNMISEYIDVYKDLLK